MFGIFKRVKRLEDILWPGYPTSLISFHPINKLDDLEERVEKLEYRHRYESELFHAFV